jgi:hypothetical protein
MLFPNVNVKLDQKCCNQRVRGEGGFWVAHPFPAFRADGGDCGTVRSIANFQFWAEALLCRAKVILWGSCIHQSHAGL